MLKAASAQNKISNDLISTK